MDMLRRFFQFLLDYPTWVQLTVLALVTVVVALLIIYRPKGEVVANRDFQIIPIQSSGENIFSALRDESGRTTNKFIVKTHFNLWTRHEIEIVNIDLQYDVKNTVSDRPKIAIDQLFGDGLEPTDSSYRMVRRHKVPRNGMANIHLFRKFLLSPNFIGHPANLDYGHVTIRFELACSAWRGIRELVVDGKLEPGGELNIEIIRFSDERKTAA